jgi:MFS family permease
LFLNDHARPTAVHWRILVLSWLGWLSVFFSLMIFHFLSSRYRDEFGVGDDAVKKIKALAIGMTGVGGILFGALGDRLGRRAAMVWSMTLCVAGVGFAAAARSAEAMMGAAALAGLGIGGQWASGQTLVGETVPAHARARFGAISQSGAPLGLALATFALIQSATTGWRTIFGLTLFEALLIPLMLFTIPESDLWKAQRERRRQGLDTDKPRMLDVWAPGVRKPFVIAFLLTLFTMANYWFTVTWLPEFMRRTWNLDITKSAWWTLSFVAGSLCGYFLFSMASERLGRRPAFSLFCAIMAGGTAMLTIFEGAIRDEPRWVLAFAAAAGVGTGVWSSFGPLYTEIFPTRVRTTAGGICMNVSRGIQFLAPLVIVAVGGQKLGAGVGLGAVFALLAGVVIWFLPETRGKHIRPD